MEHDHARQAAPRQQQQQQQQPLLQLIDEEEWFNLYGLPQAGDLLGEPTANDRAIAERVAKERDYQKTVSAKIFQQEDAAIRESKQKKQAQLQKWKTETIHVLTTSTSSTTTKEEAAATPSMDSHSQPEKSNRVVAISVNLGEFAARSDTVFCMASNQHLFHSRNCDDDDDDENEKEEDSVSATQNVKTDNPLSLSLLEYSTESVQAFLNALLSSNPTSDNMGNQETNTIPPEFVIDCCQLAHYLQCQEFLDLVVDEYLMTFMDNENCRFLCKLADELSLPRLWEAAVNHMLSSLEQFGDQNESTRTENNNNSNPSSGLWQDLSPALKAEIQALRGILQSSHRKQVYFSTYHEYLALLAEQVQYYKERLEDAQDCQTARLQTQANLQEELELLLRKRAANGWYQNARLDNQIATCEQRLEGLTKGSHYAETKIVRQQERVQALKALWKEQKKIFGGGGSTGDDENGSNPLRFAKNSRVLG